MRPAVVPLEVYVSKFAHMRFEPAGLTNDADIRTAKSIGDYIFRWMGKKFLSPEIQEELGIMSPEVRAKLAPGYRGDTPSPAADAAPAEAAPPGQTALFNHWEDAVECARAAAGWSERARATRAATAVRTRAVVSREREERDCVPDYGTKARNM
jgi:hypothetical protein